MIKWEARILAIDDEVEIRRLLNVGLPAHGYDFAEASAAEAMPRNSVMMASARSSSSIINSK